MSIGNTSPPRNQSRTVTLSDTDAFTDLHNGIRLCYRTNGPADGVPLLLVAGLGLDLTVWPRAFVDGLVGRGFRVIRCDNRDIGRSTRINQPPPSTWRVLLARPRTSAYTLRDMAADAVGLLDHLGIETAHVVGMSMGGMIAQTIAAWWPHRVITLTSMISTTGHPKVGQPAWSTKRRLLTPAATTREQYARRHVAMTHHLGGTSYPPDAATETAYAEAFWDRATEAGDTSGDGIRRQVQAIQASGDRTAELRRVAAPTLVIHGDRDLIVDPSGGIATAFCIAGARRVSIAGMGHHLAPSLLDRFVDLIAEHSSQGVHL